MKAWKDLAGIAVPPRVAALPKDERGYPIQVTAGKGTDGKIDFRAISMSVWATCVKHRRCGVCGEPLGRFVAFVGGPQSMASRAFMDAGMHKDCAQYACQVCPFIAAPRFAYARALPVLEGQTVVINEAVSTNRPSYFGLGVTRYYSVVPNGSDSLAIIAQSWDYVEWWKEGVRYDDEPK